MHFRHISLVPGTMPFPLSAKSPSRRHQPVPVAPSYVPMPRW
ncbi:hypothetical protein D3OALGA1CA_1094 [Olavius algarvensis associated proteobacterium Delta 3]|nr:hypothetical protein D3OALGA1CA_1094 [Olavius algarvensis associated proteobacterium Delta 3]